jgi:SAM-dependent methyltransferase
MKKVCPVCEMEKEHTFVESHETSETTFTIWCCTTCKLQWSDPMVADLAGYELAYREGGTELDVLGGYQGLLREADRLMRLPSWLFWCPLSSSRFMIYPQRLALDFIRQYLPAGSVVLDYGCGTGLFLEGLRCRGFKVYGLDTSATVIDFLKSKGFNAEVAHSPSEYPSGWPEPRVVTLFEVLEHLPDPLGFLRILKDSFPRSMLLLTVPSPYRVNIWLERLRGDKGDYPPNHLTRWSPLTLKVVLRKAGYHIQQIFIPPPSSTEMDIDLITIPQIRKMYYLFCTRRFIGIAVKMLFFFPWTVYYRMRGYSSMSLLAMALP